MSVAHWGLSLTLTSSPRIRWRHLLDLSLITARNVVPSPQSLAYARDASLLGTATPTARKLTGLSTKICVDVTGKLSKVAPQMEEPVDPADPSNPLKLRTQPILSDARLNLLAGTNIEPPAGQNVSRAQTKALMEAANDDLLLQARKWDLGGRKARDLHHGSKRSWLSC